MSGWQWWQNRARDAYEPTRYAASAGHVVEVVSPIAWAVPSGVMVTPEDDGAVAWPGVGHVGTVLGPADAMGNVRVDFRESGHDVWTIAAGCLQRVD